MFANQLDDKSFQFYGTNSQANIQEQFTHEGDGDGNKTNLIVNYLPQKMTEKELYSMFVVHGSVEHVRIMKDLKTGYSYGYGFVKYHSAVDAARAIASLNGKEYYNKRLKVSYARPPGDDFKQSNLYVTNLPKTITEHEIQQLFGVYGQIVQKNILRDKITGLPRGVAFVRFARRDEAQTALRNLNGRFLDGCMVPISVKVAEDHGKQKSAYYEGWKAGYHMNKGFRRIRGARGDGPIIGQPLGSGFRANPFFPPGPINLAYNYL